MSCVKKMVYDTTWIVPALRHPTRIWHFASSITVAAVGIFSKILFKFFNNAKVYNRHVIIKALDERPKNVPLITVSNHHSCFDDPGIWGTLNWRNVMCPYKMRWSMAAHDICFTKYFHAQFFMWGKCIPVVRGAGVFQPAVDFCIEKLTRGDWIHIFPEGKVNMAKEDLRFKWGVGRMIYEAPVTPIIVPIWHIGMDDVLPNEPPYYLRTRKNVTFNYGEPIDLTDLIKTLRARSATDVEARKEITDKLQSELMKLKKETEGKVNMAKEDLRFKWGVGRMIYEAPVTPIIVPIWHIGMDDVLPNEPPYYLRTRKNVTFNYGEPIDLTDLIKTLRARSATDVEARKEITDKLQSELMKLKKETEVTEDRADYEYM